MHEIYTKHAIPNLIARCPTCDPGVLSVDEVKKTVTLVGITWRQIWNGDFPFIPVCVWHCSSCDTVFSHTSCDFDSLMYNSSNADLGTIAGTLSPYYTIPNSTLELDLSRLRHEVEKFSDLKLEVENLKQKYSSLDSFLIDVRERVRTFSLR